MKMILYSICFMVLAGPVMAEVNAYDYEAIAVTSTTAIGFSAGKLSPSNGSRPKSIFISVEDANIRFRVDGTDPTTTEGHLLTTSDGVTITGPDNIRAFRAIGVSSTADMKVTYER